MKTNIISRILSSKMLIREKNVMNTNGSLKINMGFMSMDSLSTGNVVDGIHEVQLLYAVYRKYRTKTPECSLAQISHPAILLVYTDSQGESGIKLFLH